MTTSTLFDINTLPADIQNEVKGDMDWIRESHVSHQSRYFANYGFASASEYRERLLSDFKHEEGALESVIAGVLVDRYKRNGCHTESWMAPILAAHPTMLADSFN